MGATPKEGVTGKFTLVDVFSRFRPETREKPGLICNATIGENSFAAALTDASQNRTDLSCGPSLGWYGRWFRHARRGGDLQEKLVTRRRHRRRRVRGRRHAADEVHHGSLRRGQRLDGRRTHRRLTQWRRMWSRLRTLHAGPGDGVIRGQSGGAAVVPSPVNSRIDGVGHVGLNLLR